MLQVRASSVVDTHAVAAAVASIARAGDIIVLSGEMGAGKTAFAQGFGRAFGIDEPITSPTYTLVHSYDLPAMVRGARVLHHADLYRLDRTAEVADLALFELAEFAGIVLVEWGDVVESVFGDHLVVHLEPDDQLGDELGDGTNNGESAIDGDGDDEANELGLDGRRLIEISGVGPTWAARWERLRSAIDTYRNEASAC